MVKFLRFVVNSNHLHSELYPTLFSKRELHDRRGSAGRCRQRAHIAEVSIMPISPTGGPMAKTPMSIGDARRFSTGSISLNEACTGCCGGLLQSSLSEPDDRTVRQHSKVLFQYRISHFSYQVTHLFRRILRKPDIVFCYFLGLVAILNDDVSQFGNKRVNTPQILPNHVQLEMHEDTEREDEIYRMLRDPRKICS